MATVTGGPTVVTSDERRAPWRVTLVVLGVLGLGAFLYLLFAGVTSTVTEAPATGAITTKVTTTVEPVPETVSSAVLGFSAVLFIVAALYDRITKITGPGGVVVEFSDDEKKKVSETVAEKVKTKELPLKAMAEAPASASEIEVKNAVADICRISNSATLETLQSARTLLKLAQTSPESARTLAQQWGVPHEVADSSVLQSRTTPALWDALADKALSSS